MVVMVTMVFLRDITTNNTFASKFMFMITNLSREFFLLLMVIENEVEHNTSLQLYNVEDIKICQSSTAHNEMIYLSCHGPDEFNVDYVSRDTSLIIGR